jgi:hypothetical protein
MILGSMMRRLGSLGTQLAAPSFRPFLRRPSGRAKSVRGCSGCSNQRPGNQPSPKTRLIVSRSLGHFSLTSDLSDREPTRPGLDSRIGQWTVHPKPRSTPDKQKGQKKATLNHFLQSSQQCNPRHEKSKRTPKDRPSYAGLKSRNQLVSHPSMRAGGVHAWLTHQLRNSPLLLPRFHVRRTENVQSSRDGCCAGNGNCSEQNSWMLQSTHN